MHPAHIYYYYSQLGGEADIIERINSYRTVDRGVFVQRLFATWRVWVPINEEYAQFFDLAKELSSNDDYINLSNEWGVMRYFEVRLPDSTTGTYTSATAGTSYTTQVGATATITFTGTGLKFASLADNRGGLWRFSLDGGAQIVDVSVWDAVSAQKVQDVFSGLQFGEHTIVATFMGEDPSNPPAGAVPARGWICRDSVTTSNVGRFQKAFYIVGSNSPNCCHDTMSVSWTKTVLATTSHKEFAFSTRAASGTTAVTSEWIPNHTVGTTKASVFNSLSTDRRLEIDSNGTNLITSLTDAVTFAVGGNAAVLNQVYQGTNINDDDLMLMGVENLYTFTKDGVHIHAANNVLVNLHNSSMYTSMFDVSTNTQSHVLVNGQEIDVSVTTGGSPVQLINTGGIANWNGEIVSVKKTGTDFEKSLCQAVLLASPTTALKTATNPEFGGNVNYVGDVSRLKVYPTIVNGVAVPQGTQIGWDAYFVIGIVPDAYNTLTA